jgi:ribosome-associated translation inhibitor RaiA
MGAAVEVTFQEMWPSDEIVELVQSFAEDFQETFEGLTRCHVELSGARRRRGKGKRHRATVTIELQGQEEPITAEGQAPRANEAVTAVLKSARHSLRSQKPSRLRAA